MPNCENCSYKWSWTDSLKVSMMYYSGKTCSNCGEKQFISPSTRKSQWSVYFILLILIIFIRPLFDLSVTTNVLITTPILMIMIFAMPFTIQLASEHKPLW